MNRPRCAPHPASLDAESLLSQCDVQRTRRSGPGGQHRNKVETAVVLTHRPTGVEAAASERRSQHENLQSALFRLRVNLALEVRTESTELNTEDVDAHTSSELWQTRCRNRRIAVNPEHDDFPALLAEVLDSIARFGPDLHEAAEFLQCSRSQLVKFLKLDPRALASLNRERSAAGLRSLK